MKKRYLRNVVNEAYVTGGSSSHLKEQSQDSIGTALNYLASNLQSGKLSTQDGAARVQEILNSLIKAASTAKIMIARRESWEALQYLLKQIALD